MNAAVHQLIPIAQLKPSPFNRKRFDKTKMEELTENVRVQGVIVPILVRPLGDGFEIVAGERRWRAAKGAELSTVPAIVRTLTDAEALELQVIENNQREDVHPLEEAEGYEQLMKCRKADGDSYTAEDLAAKIGKSKAYVYARLKLTALSAKSREAFYGELIDASKAVLLARIPVPALQDKALKEITRSEWGNGPMNYRAAAEHIQREYMLRLDQAPFPTGDADLVKACGACTTCSKRTGNQPELFGDVKSADVCTDPPCFQGKRDAQVIRLAAAAKKNGQEVITGKDAKKIMPLGPHDMKGFLSLDETCYDDPKKRTYRQVLGKDSPLPTFVEHPVSGKLLEAVRVKDVAPLLKVKAPKAAAGVAEDESWRKKARDRDVKERLALQSRVAVYQAIRDIVGKGGLGIEDVRHVTSAYWHRLWHDAKKVIAPLWAPVEEQAPKKKRTINELLALVDDRIDSMNGEELIKLLLDCSVGFALMRNGDDDDIQKLAERHGVDAKAIKADIYGAAKEKAAAKKKTKKK